MDDWPIVNCLVGTATMDVLSFIVIMDGASINDYYKIRKPIMPNTLRLLMPHPLKKRLQSLQLFHNIFGGAQVRHFYLGRINRKKRR